MNLLQSLYKNELFVTTFFQRPLYQLQVQRNRFPTLSITLSSTAMVILALDWLAALFF